MRAGAHALSLLAAPLNYLVLAALEDGPLPLMNLRRAVGSPPQTTMRCNLRDLVETGVLERRRHAGFPGRVEYELTGPGRDLLGVAAVVQRWLRESFESSTQLGSASAKSTINALVEGWSSGIVRALAAKRLALTEISRLITGLSYPSIERRLGSLRIVGLIEPCRGNGRSTPYAVTERLRRAIAPLAAAARWERAHLPEQTAPIRRIDIEAAFLLVLPLVRLSADHSGTCRLAVEMSGGDEYRQAGVLVEVVAGRIVSCITRLDGDAGASAVGTASAWIAAVLEGDQRRLELSGDRRLAAALGQRLPEALAS